MSLPFRDRVDLLMERTKVIAGRPAWTRTQATGQVRWGGILEYEGEATGAEFVVVAYNNLQEPRFVILLNYPVCVFRAEGWERATHVNKERPVRDGFIGGMITGPHYHPWEANREWATKHTIDRLPWAKCTRAGAWL